MGISILAAALEMESDLLALEAQLDAQIAALRRMKDKARRRPEPQQRDDRPGPVVFLPGHDTTNPNFGGGSDPGH